MNTFLRNLLANSHSPETTLRPREVSWFETSGAVQPPMPEKRRSFASPSPASDVPAVATPEATPYQAQRSPAPAAAPPEQAPPERAPTPVQPPPRGLPDVDVSRTISAHARPPMPEHELPPLLAPRLEPPAAVVAIAPPTAASPAGDVRPMPPRQTPGPTPEDAIRSAPTPSGRTLAPARLLPATVQRPAAPETPEREAAPSPLIPRPVQRAKHEAEREVPPEPTRLQLRAPEPSTTPVPRKPSPEPPVIQVHIGRIEVRATPPVARSTSSPTTAPRPRPALTLNAYLKQRDEGAR